MKVKKLVDKEIVIETWDNGKLINTQVEGEKDYEIPSDDKVGTKILDIGEPNREKTKTIWVENVDEVNEINVSISIYKRLWDVCWKYYKVGYLTSYGAIRLNLPHYKEHEKICSRSQIQKFSTDWYRDSEKNMIISFVPSDDIFEIVNSNKNESIGYISYDGKVIYWNQYRS